MYYLTEYTGVNVNKTWFIVLWILVFITELAIPPIPGGSLICTGILLNQFGIPTSCIGIAATLFLISQPTFKQVILPTGLNHIHSSFDKDLI